MTNSTSSFGGNRNPIPSANSSNLPSSYGDTKIVIMPRDPLWIFCYWEISVSFVNDLKSKLGSRLDGCKTVLRIYDITDIYFNGNNAHRFFDVVVGDGASTWYINVGEFNRAWCVDLGLLTSDGEFVFVARSNFINMPRHGISNITDENWAILQVEFEKLLNFSGINQLGNSAEISRLMRQKWEEILAISMPSSGVLGGASSFKKMPRHEIAEQAKKDFWLKADTEIIVYGSTEPDASVTINSVPVPLNPDGSFSVRFYLPDGQQTYPIEAVSNDGTMKRNITFLVERKTK